MSDKQDPKYYETKLELQRKVQGFLILDRETESLGGTENIWTVKYKGLLFDLQWKEPEGITFQTDWEDGEVALVAKLVCSCGKDFLKDYGEFTASHKEIVECLKCHKKYQFIWEGMTIKEVK